VRQRSVQEASPAAAPPPGEKPRSSAPAVEKARKLSYKERQELDEIPEALEALEAEQSALHTRMADPGFFKQPPTEISTAMQRLETITQELGKLYSRWEQLSDRE